MRYFGGGVGHLGQASSRTHWKPADDMQPSAEAEQGEPEGFAVQSDVDEELDPVDDPDDTSSGSDTDF